MTKQDVFRIFSIEDLNDLPNAIMMLLTSDDITIRDEVYRELLRVNNRDVSYDWFQALYEDELAERGKKKQDFTPQSLSEIASKLTSISGSIYEPTAGNGSMLIAKWWSRCLNRWFWDFFPSEHPVTCWELSSRAIPILLLNLSIRGMTGYVFHGDVLEQEVKAKYILLNRNDDSLSFSEIILDKNCNNFICNKNDNTRII